MARGKSITEIAILALLDIKPMYGAEMVEEIKRLSGNVVVMALPTLYSCLHKLANKKYVNSYWQEAEVGGRRHIYNITQAGRQYYQENKIDIDYQALQTQTPAKAVGTPTTTYATLEEAFSLPLNNQANMTPPEDVRVIKLAQPETVPAELTITTSTPKAEPVVAEPMVYPEPPRPTPAPAPAPTPEPTFVPTQTTFTTLSMPEMPVTATAAPDAIPTPHKVDTIPYIMPSDKISITANKQKQMTINLSGTVGSADLRPLAKLNQIQAGNNYVAINRLRFFACLCNTIIFMFANLLLTLTQALKSEYLNFIFIIFFCYFAIVIAIYLVFPKVKAMFRSSQSLTIRISITFALQFIIVLLLIIRHSARLFWLCLFAFAPITEYFLMTILRKGNMFAC